MPTTGTTIDLSTDRAGTTTVLVVEDDPSFQVITRRVIEGAGHRVVVAACVHDAIDLLSADPDAFHAVVLDLDLPDASGSETLDLVRRMTTGAIVLHSSTSSQELLTMGADAVVCKLDTVGELLPAIDRAVALRPTDRLALPPASADVGASAEFQAVARTVVEDLAARRPEITWAVTTVVGDAHTVLEIEDPNYGVPPGTVLSWSDSFCSRMVEGGPRIAPDLDAIPLYADVALRDAVPLGCYIGVPIALGTETLYGTLCGLAPEAATSPDSLLAEADLFDSYGRILSAAVTLEAERGRVARRLEIAEQAARRDALTGLGNRRAWDRALQIEETRSARYGHGAGVIVLDLDGLKVVNDRDGHEAGDHLLCTTARVLESVVRDTDAVFRTGGDEFAVLLVELDCDIDQIRRRIVTALERAGISASIGSAARDARTALGEAATLADARMYEAKHGIR